MHDYENQTVSLIRGGLQRLSPSEVAYLDEVVTEDVRALFVKAFGPEMHDILRPLVENDDHPGAEGPVPSEGDLRKRMRDPRYWRDRDPEFMDSVSRGFERLYPERGGR